MPFTPFHFGPCACIALPMQRRLDLAIFLGVNIAIDVEPGIVMTCNLNYPLHGYAHTLFIGGLIGLGFAAAAYPFRQLIGKVMSRFRLPYAPTFAKMLLSGIIGAWLHVLLDATLYPEMNPFFPLRGNPMFGSVPFLAVYGICAILFVPALVIYSFIARQTMNQVPD